MHNKMTVSTLPTLMLGLLAVVAGTPLIAAPLDVAKKPLYVTNNVPPNVIMAIDDSGSMDFEVLQSTNGGTLWRRKATRDFYDSQDEFHSPAQSEQQQFVNYSYLFPNGYDGSTSNPVKDDLVYLGLPVRCVDRNDDGDFNDQNEGCFLSLTGQFESSSFNVGGYHALAPIPELAFARSPDFNRSYFNPAVDYQPWPNFDDVDPTAASFDPSVGTDDLDLTDSVRRNGLHERFLLAPGMTLPAGAMYHADIDGGDRWEVNNQDRVFDEYAQTAIEYFPATFYLESALPGSFGFTGQALTGAAPDGSTLLGYEIKRNNFSSEQAYDAMLQNFANWFTYYRKRHLATRGGIASAFEKVGNMRVGFCTINERQNIDMVDLNENRESFNQDIAEIEYWRPQGTPNREALRHVGDQVATNEDILQQPCQQNFAVLFTDGYTSDRDYSAGVGNADGDNGQPFADNKANTMADIGMYFYETLHQLDRAAGFAKGKVLVPSGCPNPRLDCNTNLHLNTFGVTLGQQGTIFGRGTAAANDPYANPPNWNDLTLGVYSAAQVDDLWHATINSRGTLLNANTPQETADVFAETLQEIASRAGSSSSLSINSGTIASDSRLFQASFQSGQWTGELLALPISDGSGNSECTAFNPGDATTDPSGDAIGDICEPEWSASAALGQQTERMIIANIGGTGAPFRVRSLPRAQRTQTAENVINYLRGDASREARNDGPWRNRSTTILGDIVNSSPIYVGAPDRIRYPADWDDKRTDGNDTTIEDGVAAYRDPSAATDFTRSFASRTPMVYVGANDGMLHGFNADTGAEEIAFVPGAFADELARASDPLQTKLGALVAQSYDHEFFVDGNPVVGDVVIEKNGSAGWRTVLVSGLRAGGKSVFALDVTDPSAFTEANAENLVLWEFSDDDDLGLTYSEPAIVRLHNGRWAAVFGNGFNSANQSAVLFVVDIATGDVIRKIDTRTTPGGNNPGFANGLGSVFPVDLDADFITDYIYAGDLYGNLWKFDLTSTSGPNEWSAGFGSAENPEPLFTACSEISCSAQNRQPITVKPQIAAHPLGLDYGVMAYFGTGKYFENADRAADTDAQHSFYGIWDIDVFSVTENADGPPFSTSVTHGFGRNRLTLQTVTSDVNSQGQTYRLVSGNEVQYQQSGDADQATTEGADKRGFVLNLPANSGEMIVTDATLRGKIVAVSTLIPSEVPCDVGGTGFFMVLDAATGGQTSFAALDLNEDREFDSSDTLNGENPSGVAIEGGAPGRAGFAIARELRTDIAEVPVSDASIERIDVNTGLFPDGRRTWRELRR